jgi:DNA polymerase III subunit gamma/tau
MAYQAIARRWRPHKFEDLVGQGHVVQTLKNAIATQRVSHAYLFSGARGVGKTSVARIFAKALRCPNAQNAVPCNTCPECVAIAESRSVDVAEIDGASHNGVEAVRSIRDNVAYSASTGFYKIYIIDEAHMLSLSAFNALLKTLEEPPAHVIFIMATTESQKIPVTILSRCQRFEFRRLSQTQIVDRLKQILEAEGVKVSEAGMRTLASHADGSLRDALSLLDQVLSHDTEGGELTETRLVSALGISPTSSVTEFWACIAAQDVAKLLTLLNSAYAAGIDLKHFAERCMEELRLLYLMALSKENKIPVTAETLDIASSHYSELEKVAALTNRVALERMAQILNHAIGQLGWASQPRFVLEMTAVRMAQLEPLAQLEQALGGQVAARSAPATKPRANSQPTAAATPAPVAVSQPKPAVSSVPAASPSAQTASPAKPAGGTPQPTTPPAPSARPAASVKPAAEPIEPDFDEPPPITERHFTSNEPPPGPPPVEGAVARPIPPPPVAGNTGGPNWQAFIDSVMKKRPLLGALLCHGEFRLEPGKKVALTFPLGSFYERQAQDKKNRVDIEDQLKLFFGQDVVLLLDGRDAASVRSREKTMQDEINGIKKEALGHPSVMQMKEELGAEVVDVNVEI